MLEEAEAFLKLKEEHFLSAEEVSKIIGRPRTSVANLIRVASMLSPEGKLLWESGGVDYGHIRAVIMLDRYFQNLVLQYVILNKLSVRDTENLIRNQKYLKLDNNFEETGDVSPKISKDDLEKIGKKFWALCSKTGKIKALKTGKIMISMVFEDINDAYHYFDNKSSN